MENETIETLLQNLGLESSLDLFRHQHIDLDALKLLTEDELKGVLMELNLPIGHRIKITAKLKEIRDGGKCTIYSIYCIIC